MITAGAFEAKTHFSQFLDKVIKGQVITITRHGQQVAQLIPFGSALDKKENSIEKNIKIIRQLRKGTILGKNFCIQSLKEMGRK